MDEHTRKIFDKARATLERVDNEQFQWAAEAAQRDPLAEWDRTMPTKREHESDIPAGVDPVQWANRHHCSGQQPHNDDGLRRRVESFVRHVREMEPETNRRWDEWCDARIHKMMDDAYADAIAEFVVEYVGEKLKSVREEIGQLRADMNVQTGIARGQIAEIKRDVA